MHTRVLGGATARSGAASGAALNCYGGRGATCRDDGPAASGQRA